jgi:hypothetical protein
MCVCVCVWKRERGREREKATQIVRESEGERERLVSAPLIFFWLERKKKVKSFRFIFHFAFHPIIPFSSFISFTYISFCI